MWRHTWRMTPPDSEETAIPEGSVKFDEDGNLVYRVGEIWQPYLRLASQEGGGFEMRDHDLQRKHSAGTEE